MLQSFLPTPTATDSLPVPSLLPPQGDREPVQILVIGSNQGITNVIHTLYSLHFAHISEWSPLMPAPVPGKLMRVLTRQIPIV